MSTLSARDSIELAGRDPVGAFFVLVRSLVADSDELREPLLSETQHYSPFEYARADVAVERVNTPSTGIGLCTGRPAIALARVKEVG
jgi:hypothetical protein